MIKNISLDEIDVSDFLEVKSRVKWYDYQDHSRWIFKDVENNLYYKIWNETYVRRDAIPITTNISVIKTKLNSNVPAKTKI